MNNKRTTKREEKMFVELPYTCSHFDYMEELNNLLEVIKDNEMLSLISVPLNCSKADVTGNDKLKGNSIIGYVNSININNNTIGVVLFEKHTDIMKKYNNPCILLNLLINKANYIDKILSFKLVNLVASEG